MISRNIQANGFRAPVAVALGLDVEPFLAQKTCVLSCFLCTSEVCFSMIPRTVSMLESVARYFNGMRIFCPELVPFFSK